MAVSFVRDHVAEAVKAAGTTDTYATTTLVPAGNLLVAALVHDNAATANAPTVSSISKPANETATWTFLGRATYASTGTSGAFANGELWVIRTTVDWPNATSLTFTYSTSITMKAQNLLEFFGVLATQRSTVGTNYSTTTTAASATTTGTTPVIGDLAIGLIFGSNVAAAQAGDTDTTGGSWGTKVSVGSTGGGAANNNFGVVQYKILTTASHQTLNNSAAMTAGNGSIIAILQQRPLEAPVTSFSASATSVTTGGTVTFTDTSTGDPGTSWAWDFGTGASPATATTKGPHVVTYSTTGDSSVTYSSTNAAGTVASTPKSITVNAPPAGAGRPKIWTGSAWATKPLKVWSGTAWVEKPVKVWTGSEWKIIGSVPTGAVQHSVFGASPPAATYTSYDDAGYEGWVATQFYITASPARNWTVVGTRLYLHAGSSLIGRSGAIGAKRRALADGGIHTTENPPNDLDTNIMYTPFSTPLVAGWNDRMFVTTIPMNSLDGVIVGWVLQGYYVYSTDLDPGGIQAADGVNLYLAESSGGSANRSYYAPTNAADLGKTVARHYGIDIIVQE